MGRGGFRPPARPRGRPHLNNAKQQYFIQSAARIRNATRQDQLTRVSSSTLRRMHQPGAVNHEELAPRSRQYGSLLKSMLEEIYDKTSQNAIIQTKGPSQLGKEAADKLRHGVMGNLLGLAKPGLPQSIEGLTVFVDELDRPYVVVANGEMVFVQVYKARMHPSGKLDGQCTIENPDGLEEYLLVEEMPYLSN